MTLSPTRALRGIKRLLGATIEDPEKRRFFEDYKSLENKAVKVEDFLGQAEAFRAIDDALAMYKSAYPQK